MCARNLPCVVRYARWKIRYVNCGSRVHIHLQPEGASASPFLRPENCEMQKQVCNLFGGTAKATFCDAKGSFCDLADLAIWSGMSDCSKDSDCVSPSMPTPCCATMKSVFESLCENFQAAALDEYIKEGGGCTEAACTASGSLNRAGMLYLLTSGMLQR